MIRIPQSIVFQQSGINYISIRFSNPNWKKLHDLTNWAGFSILFADYNYAVKSSIENERSTLLEQLIFLIPALLLAILHSFIYIFDRKTKQNLFYVFFLISFSLYIFLVYFFKFTPDQITSAYLNRFFVLLLNYILLFGAFTIFKVCNYNQKFLFLFWVLATLLGLLGFLFPGKPTIYYITYGFIVYVSFRAGKALAQKNIGEHVKIIRIGFILFSISGVYQILLSFGLVVPIFGIYSVFLYGILFFILFMSIGLAKEFVDNKKKLEIQLHQVKELSEKTLQQELAAKELETEKKYLELENERKSTELDDAKNLQLSMLPNNIPEFKNLELFFYLKTATEVGGDYYDIIPISDNSLIIAIGDATGHGAKAGLMVAVMKSLFKSLAPKYLITDFFKKSNEIIKDMKLGNLFMSLSMVRINDNYVVFSSAGMPPTMIYRANTKKIEKFIFKSMPLGAFKDFPYETKETTLYPGDVILSFSDGLSELFNDRKKMFGLEKIEKILKESGELQSKEIIDEIIKNSNEWLKNSIQNDDITIVAIKYK